VVGTGTTGYKRDPYARELGPADAFPNCSSILRSSASYPWHDVAFRTPDFSDVVIYQIHIGTYAIARPGTSSNFLDVACKVPYLAGLGINMLQPLPIDEQEVNPGMGYGGADLFSPDFCYVASEDSLAGYLTKINDLLVGKGFPALALSALASAPAQLKALVDVCHVYGIAVTFAVVYNHAGGFTVDDALDDNCLYYFDRAPDVGDNNDSLYFTNQDRGTGGLAFAMWNQNVCRYLEDNARYYLDEFHADGIRYDEIGILLSTNQANGWTFCRTLTSELRAKWPRLLQNAEFWPGEFSDTPPSLGPILAPICQGGAGFDVAQHGALRLALRGALGAAAYGASADVPMSALAAALYPPVGRKPRAPMLADSTDPRSWYARSRSRVATGLLLTAPGIPQLFMGQEFLEHRPWDSNPSSPNVLDWAALEAGDKVMADHLRFTRELIGLRSAYPALRSDNVHPYYVSDTDRVLALHRWGASGEDVIVVVTLSESTWWRYDLGFPARGLWREVFNSDVYDNWVNPWTAGNGGGIEAQGPPMHGFVTSATIVIPANAVVVFTCP
jgi:1,4-alpha-glucan branching enzyme